MRSAVSGPMRVLVATEHSADDRKTLAAVRALGRSGVEVTVGSDVTRSAPLWSRYCHHRLRYPSPVHEAGAFTQWLLEELDPGAFDVLLPLSDYTTNALATLKPLLEQRVGLPLPDKEQLTAAHDKFDLLETAKRLGVGVPRTHCPASRAELETISAEIEYPCVLKLRRGAGAVGLSFPRSASELLDCYDNLQAPVDPVFSTDRPLVQEYIPGFIHDACMLFNRGTVRAALTQKRLLMYPEQGGVGIYNETTDEPELRDQAGRLLSALQWHGPAMVEFKKDSRDQSYKLMEINSRYWGTLDLAIQAGVNVPLLACYMARDGDIEPVGDYRVGLRYRWIWPHGFQYARRHEHPWRALWQFLRPARDIRSEFRLSDPLPHLAHSAELFRRP